MKAYIVKLERNHIGIWGLGRQPPEASDISKNQIKWKPDIYLFFLKKKLHICFFESLCSEIVKKLHWYIGVWGKNNQSQIIKWYVPKKKASYLIFDESLCSEIG